MTKFLHSPGGCTVSVRPWLTRCRNGSGLKFGKRGKFTNKTMTLVFLKKMLLWLEAPRCGTFAFRPDPQIFPDITLSFDVLR